MSRITGGQWRGRVLRAPAGSATRPTTERTREALFSALTSARPGGLPGSRVLDLYAGSGALGLEAASRGAAAVVCVESAAAALTVLRANVASLDGGEVVAVVAAPVARHLGAGPAGSPYDVVLLDPPYEQPVDADLLALVAGGWVAPGGIVVVERSTRAAGVVWPDGLEPVRDRKYGETTLCYGRRP